MGKAIGIIVIILAILFVVGILGNWYDNNPAIQVHNISVISQSISNGNNYILYVPGNNSTCKWSYTNPDGSLDSSITQGSGLDAKHQLELFGNIFNMKVSCLDGSGINYTGIFSQ